jgi:hypothetical protein
LAFLRKDANRKSLVPVAVAREQPRSDIGAAARPQRHDEAHLALRPCRLRRGGGRGRNQGRQHERKAGANGP